MKNFLFILSLLLSTAAFAQNEDSIQIEKRKEEQRALKIERQVKRAEVDKKFKKFSKDRFAIDLMGTNWIYNNNSAGMNGLQTKWYSRGINIYFHWDFRIKQSRFSIAPGIGYSSSNIYSRHGLVEDSLGTHFQKLTDINPAITESSYKVNKVTLQYLDIPVEFRIRTNPDKFNNCFKFAFGFKAGIRVDAHTKQKIKDTSTKVYVERRFPDFSLFRMGPTFRFGYSSFNITAYYGVLGVFKKDRGPKANEFAVGISFNGL